MIIFDNNDIERELIVPKGLNLWHFLYVKTKSIQIQNHLHTALRPAK